MKSSAGRRISKAFATLFVAGACLTTPAAAQTAAPTAPPAPPQAESTPPEDLWSTPRERGGYSLMDLVPGTPPPAPREPTPSDLDANAHAGSAADQPTADPAIVGLAIAVFALLRQESRGAHARTDFPTPLSGSTSRRMTLDDILAVAEQQAALSLPRSA